VTASGTNQLHGDVFEYLRNSAMDARNFFDATIGTPPFKRHQFGGALGGPIKKDKMFLFGTPTKNFGKYWRAAASRLCPALTPVRVSAQALLADRPVRRFLI
jgi:hypothetical protein